MTADQRLDQLEPVMGEMAAQLDLHTAQNRRVAVSINNVVQAISQQSDNITFLLEGQARHSTEIKEVKTRLEGVETRLEGVETRLEGVETRLEGVETRLERIEDMVTAIYQAVQKPSGN